MVRTLRVDKPADAALSQWFNGQIILTLRSPWRGMPAGSVVALGDSGPSWYLSRPRSNRFPTSRAVSDTL
ncbi:MAG: hypothetical protein HC902_12000 [Calothrix sp. SM1_5_4]|nr:hypothetical protein [Calothrix sp. SM1_5_4]